MAEEKKIGINFVRCDLASNTRNPPFVFLNSPFTVVASFEDGVNGVSQTIGSKERKRGREKERRYE